MTTPMPASGEPVSQFSSPEASVDRSADLDDHRGVRLLWWKTIAVMAIVLLATVAVVAWQWLGPASGTVTR